MLRRDYILRMVDDLGRLVQEIVQLRNEKKFKEVDQTIALATSTYYPFSLEELIQFSSDNLADELITKRKLHPQQIRLLAELCFQKGMTQQDQIETGSHVFFRHSTVLFQLFLQLEPNVFDMEVFNRLSFLNDFCQS
jgi:hypothetical protein